MMKPVNHIILKITENSVTLGGRPFYIDHTYNPEQWVTSYGEVTASSKEEIKVGDLAYVDYYSVLMALGKKFNNEQKSGLDCKYIENQDGLFVFLPPQSVFFVVRDGKMVGVNGFEIISPDFEEGSTILKTEKKMGKTCSVLTGEYAGKTMIFRQQRMRNCGQYGFNSKDFYVIHKDYLLAEVEK